VGSRYYRGAASRPLIDDCHFADDTGGLESFVDRAAAHNPQCAFLDDVERVRCIAFSKQKLPGIERNELGVG